MAENHDWFENDHRDACFFSVFCCCMCVAPIYRAIEWACVCNWRFSVVARVGKICIHIDEILNEWNTALLRAHARAEQWALWGFLVVVVFRRAKRRYKHSSLFVFVFFFLLVYTFIPFVYCVNFYAIDCCERAIERQSKRERAQSTVLFRCCCCCVNWDSIFFFIWRCARHACICVYICIRHGTDLR